MPKLKSFIFPDIPPNLSDLLFKDDREMVVIGVLGKSSHPDCNKMAGFQILDFYPSLFPDDGPKDGQIKFYFEQNSNILYVHFITPFDSYALQKYIDKLIDDDESNGTQTICSINSYARIQFARSLLFAIHVCHIIVLVETSNVFDASYLSLFQSLKTIREKYVLKFLPKLLKNSNVGIFMGKDGRLCSPRFLFYFEKYLAEYDDNDTLQKFEFDTEDKIYKMLRNEFIITNNSSISLFSIPRNKRFVYINSNPTIRSDPLLDSLNVLAETIENTSNKYNVDDDLDDVRPFKDFGRPIQFKNSNKNEEKPVRSVVNLLKEHCIEALENGFDDSVAKFKGKGHFVIPNVKTWYEIFKIIHKIFIENPDNATFEANDADYKAYLENFKKMVDVDERFFSDCCNYGLELAIDHYRDNLPHHYNSQFHQQKIFQSYEVFMKYARTPNIELYELKLRKACDKIWLSGKQQCEFLSLRGNPCIVPKHDANEEHSSGVVFLSICNCGRTKGHREDPYSIRQANYDFYQILANNCNGCSKAEQISFSIFEPSTADFRAAELELKRSNKADRTAATTSQVSLTFVSQTSPLLSLHNLSSTFSSLESINEPTNEITEEIPMPVEKCELIRVQNNDSDDENANNDDDDDLSVNEIVIKVGESQEAQDKNVIIRQPSTTEYLPGMVHTLSPPGLLPQYPSWSLVCIGPSSVYSHNSGLPEHVQSGFLSGANFLLPWDVHVRLEHAATWAANYEKGRIRKKPQQITTDTSAGQVFVLKIFIGCEYECLRGHRFIMNTPDKVLRGGSGIVRDSGSKVVFNDMPLYFPCPCRNTPPQLAQLMRIHIVTPKAPVNVILDPKIRVNSGNSTYEFILGQPEPPKLTQSAYWILRLPFVYQGDDGPIMPPTEVTVANSMMHGCLLAGMYGITETETAHK